MRPKTLALLLNKSFQNGRRVLIKGKPGIGKSDIVAQAAAEIGADLLISHPAISDPTDYKGMPAMLANGRAEFVPFGDLTRLIEASKLTIAFLDDIGQAAPAVQAALMQLVLARRVNGHKISDHVVFCGATNDTSHMASVSGMIEPLKSRWDTIVELEVSLDDFSTWWLSKLYPVEPLAYLRFRPAHLSDFKPTRELRNSPSPRGWASIAHWMMIGVKDIEVYSGAIGEGVATEFFGFLDMFQKLPNLDQIILDPDSVEVPDSPSALFAIAGGLARKATAANFDRVTRYTARMPVEFDIVCTRDAVRLDKTITNSAAFTQWAVKHSEVLL